MDAAFLQASVASALAKACADTIAASPPDPIHHLSLCLLNHVSNPSIRDAFLREKRLSLQRRLSREQAAAREEAATAVAVQEAADAVRRLRGVGEAGDPYLLFDSCLKAVEQFTGCSSAYIALVLDKQWEPPKKVLDSEDEEGLVNEDEAEEEEVEEEEVEEEQKEEVEEQEIAGNGDTDDAALSNEALQDQQEVLKIEKLKPKKPIKYHKKVLLYVATTPNNEFLINKQLDKKLGQATFSVLLQRLPKLHIPNVLYQEGIHFFQGMPLMGAYLTVPVALPTNPIQVVALLCADTLRKQSIGTGRPFSHKEQEFIENIAQVITEVLMQTGLGTSNSFNTKEIIQTLQKEIKQLKKSHKAELRRERLREAQASETDVLSKEDESKDGEEIKKDDDDIENKTDDETVEEEEEEKEEEEEEEEEAEAEEGKAEEEEAEEEEEEEGEEEEEEEEAAAGGEANQDAEKQLREIGKLLKQHQKKVKNCQKQFQKSQSVLEKQSLKVKKLEKKVRTLDGALTHLLSILATILDTLVQHKDIEFKQIKQCLFPSPNVHRILKGLLFVLGHPRSVIEDWTKSRKILNGDYICTAMKEYKPLSDEDLKKWELCDVYMESIADERLSEEAPIGYICRQWLIVARKVAFKTIKLNTYKIKNDAAAKDFADAELEQMVAEIDLGVAKDEEKKVIFQLEQLQSKVADEIASAPNDEEENGED